MKLLLHLLAPFVWLLPVVAIAYTRHAAATDGFVSMLEQRFTMQPGQTRVLPECGCTIRYIGTSVNGRHYDVRIDRLD